MFPHNLIETCIMCESECVVRLLSFLTVASLLGLVFLCFFLLFTRGIQKVRRPTQLTTRYADRIL